MAKSATGARDMDIRDVRNNCRDWLERALRPVAWLLMRIKVTPNQISAAGSVSNVVAAWYVISGDFVLAGTIYLAAGVLDLLDGALARLAGQTTTFGALLDSTLDRFSEGIVFAAIAYHFAALGASTDASSVVLALMGSFLISYIRARAESLGHDCDVGLITRAERVLILAAGLLFGILPEMIYLLVGLTWVTVAQRLVHVSRQMERGRDVDV